MLAAKTTEGAAARSLDIARSLREGGVATLGAVLQAETAYDLAVLAGVQANATAKLARGNLAVVIGSSADQALQIGLYVTVDVLTAQTAASNARLLRVNAEFGWQVARAQLALALGRLSGT